ncbi:family 18 glycosyltransferase [Melampsora americana]|nr:family 18 glycosyltransferase [Melampsora americana]
MASHILPVYASSFSSNALILYSSRTYPIFSSHCVLAVEEKGFTYLGLTLEHYCHHFGVVPASKRVNKIYVLGKDRAYLHKPAPVLWNPTIFEEIANETGVSFTIGTVQKSISKLHGDERDELWPGLDDVGSLSRDDFIYQIQHHRAVMGLGWSPQISSPLEALCLGTPFINRRRSEPDRSKWHTQHPYLAHFDPPYVYNVQDHRKDDLLEAVNSIMKNPLKESFIPDDMKKEAYLARIDSLVTRNWLEHSRSKSSPSNSTVTHS